MTVKDAPRPQLQDPRDVVVKVTYAAICGSDLHTYHGILGGDDVPYLMGHEAIGVISEAGKEVQSYHVGDHVVVPDIHVVGSTTYIYGEGDALGPDIGGCQAEYVRVPLADSALIPISKTGGNDLDYLTLADIFATGWGSITSTGFQPGDTVAIYGAGPVGLLAAYSALLRGASRVYSIDHVEARLQKAKSVGAIPINLTEGLPSTQILKHEPSGVNRAADCIGYECLNTQLKLQEDFVVNDAIKVTATGGGIGITGVYYSGPRDKGEPRQSPKLGVIKFDIGAWWLKNVSINGGPITAGSAEPALRELVASGRAKPGFVFDKIVSIDEAPEAYRLFDEKKVEKVAIKF
ncbi:MAG: hypothetical protein Q9227_005365 [Pyrenula ochraceoflavens]